MERINRQAEAAAVDISWRRLALFGLPSLAINIFIITLYSYLPPFYAADLGLGLATTGAIFMAMRFWDLVADLVIGGLIDRYPTRYGSRKPWILLALPWFLVAIWLVFFPSPPVGPLYLLAGLWLLFTGYTLFYVPYQAWSAELVPDYDGRSRVMAWVQGMMQVGIAITLVVTTAIEQRGGNMADQVAMIGWLVIVLFPVSCMVLILFFRESKFAVAGQPARFEWRALVALLRQRALVQVMAANLMLGLVGGLVIPILFFFVDRALLLTAWQSTTLLVMVLGSLPLIPLCLHLSARMGKDITLIAVGFAGAAAALAMAMIPAGNVALLLASSLLFGTCYSVGGFLTRALLADVADDDARRTGSSRVALIFALQLSVEKIGPAIGVFVGYGLLAWVGFDPTRSDSPPEAVQTLRLLVGAGGGGLFLLSALSILRYPLTRAAVRGLE